MRERFFRSCLTRLGKASVDGFESLKEQCRVEAEDIGKQYPQVPILEDAALQADDLPPVHSYSRDIFPTEWHSDYYPVKCVGDGNCLYRYMYQ